MLIQFSVKQKVAPEHRAAYDEVVRTLFVPAVSKQPGFVAFRMFDEYPEELRTELGAVSDGHHVLIELTFESEELRQQWTQTPEHDRLGEGLQGLVEGGHFTGYELALEQVR